MKYSKFIIILNLGLSIMAMALVHAATTVGLYEGRVPVKDFSARVRQKALPAALQQVFIKVSGNPGVTTLSAMQTSLNNANSLVNSYSYIERIDEGGNKILLLNVKFDSSGIEQLLRSANQAIWSTNRPLILVWLKISERDGKNEIVSEDDSRFSVPLQDSACSRGVPILLPLMDLQDVNNVDISDIQNFNLAAIQIASERYHQGAILIGNIYQDLNNNWHSKWLFSFRNSKINWTIGGKNSEKIMQTAVNYVADELASRAAVLSSSELHQQVNMLVNGVNSLDECVAVMKYLLGLNVVSNVKLVSVNPHSVNLKVVSSRGIHGLIQAIKPDHLQPADLNFSDTQNVGAELIYYWVSVQQ